MLCHDSSLLRRLYAKITWPVSVRTLMDPTNFLSSDHWNVRYHLGLSSHSRCQRRTSNGQYEDVVVLLALRRPLPYPPIHASWLVTAEVGSAEVGFAEVGFDQIGPHCVKPSPRIPTLHAFLKARQMI
jgi:hypothetical protein